MERNGARSPRRPRIAAPTPTPSPQEAAAIAAALERFLAETAPVPVPAKPQSGWLRAALREGVEAEANLGAGWGALAPQTE